MVYILSDEHVSWCTANEDPPPPPQKNRGAMQNYMASWHTN